MGGGVWDPDLISLKLLQIIHIYAKKLLTQLHT